MSIGSAHVPRSRLLCTKLGQRHRQPNNKPGEAGQENWLSTGSVHVPQSRY